tara:strand:+ start:532 stop:900 length:369 start_codon:yes stop_codon:yes gene_type:complete
MDKKGRPNHINDILCQLHTNSWYEYTDNANQVYSNLRLADKIGVGGVMVDNPVTELPSEEVLNAKLKESQDTFDAVNNDVLVARRREYPSIEECVHAILDDNLVVLQEKRTAVKLKYPKEGS